MELNTNSNNSNLELKDAIERIFINKISSMFMDIPDNFEEIVQFIFEDVLETSSFLDEGKFSEDDVIIGFRRWIESKS